MTAPTIHSLGITWSGNNPTSEITTGSGPAHTGAYGFFQLPHGDWASGTTDGLVGTGDTPLVAIGGWVETNTPPAKLGLYLDGVGVSFSGTSSLWTSHGFFGAIQPAGFSSFEFRELEATPGDWKFIFADDFSFAFGGTLLDCNMNGIGDALDIASGWSVDCDGDFVPDECQIDAAGGAAGGPYFCQSDCDADCNLNGVPDGCELVQPILLSSPALGPFGDGSPQSFSFPSPPSPAADVLFDVRAFANLGGGDEFVTVRLNGTPVGNLFVSAGEDCPGGQLSEDRLTIPLVTFLSLVGAGAAHFEFVASTEVNATECDTPSFIEVDLTIFRPSSLDANMNGILDACEEIGTRYCPSAPNSVDAGGAQAWAFGSPIVTQNDLGLVAAQLPPNVFGLHYFGPQQVQLPVGDGFRCVGGSPMRLDVTSSSSAGVAVTELDLGAPPLNGVLLPGTTHNFQFWYRDTQGGPAGFNFSNAVEVVLQ